jgi:hypothetical protein
VVEQKNTTIANKIWPAPLKTSLQNKHLCGLEKECQSRFKKLFYFLLALKLFCFNAGPI